jgi:hypothetical protein
MKLPQSQTKPVGGSIHCEGDLAIWMECKEKQRNKKGDEIE